MDKANEKYVAMGEAAHLQADELEIAIKEQLRRAVESGDTEGPKARKLVAMHRLGFACIGLMACIRLRFIRHWRMDILPMKDSVLITKKWHRVLPSSYARQFMRVRDFHSPFKTIFA